MEARRRAHVLPGGNRGIGAGRSDSLSARHGAGQEEVRMKLVIAEKADLARDIARAVAGAPAGCRLPFEGGGYRVVALAGHVLELDEPGAIDPERWGNRRDLSVLPILPVPWPKHAVESKKGLLNNVRRGLAECDSVVAAGDPDDEGQLLVDEVLDYLGYRGRVERVYVNDNLEKNIRRAFGRLVDNRECRAAGEAALARQVADFCFGVNESRLIAAKAGRGIALSVGRVQTPTLGLVVRRDDEIMGHVSREYYTARATVEVDGSPLEFEFKPDKRLLDSDDGKLCLSREAMEAAIAKAKGMKGTLETMVERKRYPAPLPYNLTDLTADMSKRFKLSAKQVLEATQALREEHHAITYNRSDCNYLPMEAFGEAPAVMAAAMGNVGKTWALDFSRPGRAFDDASITAHTGIIPQETRFDAAGLPRTQRVVYESIVERYAMQFMGDFVADVSISEIALPDGRLAHSCKRPHEPGWKAVRAVADEDDKEMQEGWLAAGSHGYEVASVEVAAKKTKPKPPYTEGTLIKDMASIAKYVRDPEMRAALKEKDKGKKGEHGGIGTTATRAAIIESLKKKGYVQERSGKLISTPLGRAVYEACPEDIKGADLTARWWLMCEEVRAGRADPYSVAKSVCEEFKKHEATAYEGIAISRDSTAEAMATCPACGKRVIDPGAKARTWRCEANRVKKSDEGTWVHEGPCRFEVWKTVAGKKLTTSQVKALCEKGKTGVIRGFKSKAGKTFDARLILMDKGTGKVGFEFADGKGGGKGNEGHRPPKQAPKKSKPVRE